MRNVIFEFYFVIFNSAMSFLIGFLYFSMTSGFKSNKLPCISKTACFIYNIILSEDAVEKLHDSCNGRDNEIRELPCKTEVDACDNFFDYVADRAGLIGS